MFIKINVIVRGNIYMAYKLNLVQQEIKKAIVINNTSLKDVTTSLGYNYSSILNQLNVNTLSDKKLTEIANALDIDAEHLISLKYQIKNKK